MKKTHIIAIVVIAAAIAIIVSTAGDASTYVSFDQAFEMAKTGNKASIHVVGDLKKNADGTVLGLEESPDHLSFSFLLIDEKQQVQKVYYNEPMPPDFTRSEKVVVVGSYHNDLFVADKILLKCPSKYQENKLKAGA